MVASSTHLHRVQAVELLGVGVLSRLVQRDVAVLQLGPLQYGNTAWWEGGGRA